MTGAIRVFVLRGVHGGNLLEQHYLTCIADAPPLVWISTLCQHLPERDTHLETAGRVRKRERLGARGNEFVPGTLPTGPESWHGGKKKDSARIGGWSHFNDE